MLAIRLGLIGLVLMTLSACQRSLETNGKYLTDAQADALYRGMSVDAVRTQLGAPSYISAIDENFWAYIGTRSQVRIFDNPKPVERRIVALQISGGVIRDIVQLDIRDGQQIYPNPDRTPTSGRTIGLMEELLGNIGRF